VATYERSSNCPSRGWFVLRDPCERREHRGVGKLGESHDLSSFSRSADDV